MCPSSEGISPPEMKPLQMAGLLPKVLSLACLPVLQGIVAGVSIWGLLSAQRLKQVTFLRHLRAACGNSHFGKCIPFLTGVDLKSVCFR